MTRTTRSGGARGPGRSSAAEALDPLPLAPGKRTLTMGPAMMGPVARGPVGPGKSTLVMRHPLDASGGAPVQRRMPDAPIQCAGHRYEPQRWQDRQGLGGRNCYVYAINYLTALRDDIFDPGDGAALQDGLLDDSSLPDRTQLDVHSVRQAAERDGLIWIGAVKPLQPRDGYYLVCLLDISDDDVVEDGQEPLAWHEREYHWRRQDEDGTWSEKLGESAPQKVNGAETAPIDDYDRFVGYFWCPDALNFEIVIGVGNDDGSPSHSSADSSDDEGGGGRGPTVGRNLGGMPPFGGQNLGGMPPFGGQNFGGMPPFGGQYFGGQNFGGMPPFGGQNFGGMPPFGGQNLGMPPLGGQHNNQDTDLDMEEDDYDEVAAQKVELLFGSDLPDDVQRDLMTLYEGEDSEDSEDNGLFLKATPGASPSAPTAAVPDGAGRPLPDDVRGKMERAFDADFSGVRVHEGEQAAGVGAEAYAQGEDLHFAPGRYAPGTPAGDELLGHELAHVVQQRTGRVARPQGRGAPVNTDAGLEAEADRAGAQAARGEPAGVAGHTAGGAAAKPAQRP